MENTNCLSHICRKYQLLEKLRENHTRWELSRFTQEAAISTPMFEFASDSFPEAANMRNLALSRIGKQEKRAVRVLLGVTRLKGVQLGAHDCASGTQLGARRDGARGQA